MNWKALNYMVDVGLLISFILVFITGIIKFPELQQILGINRLVLPFYEITLIHDWSGLIMGLLVFTHLLLHRRFIAETTKRYLGFGRKSNTPPFRVEYNSQIGSRHSSAT